MRFKNHSKAEGSPFPLFSTLWDVPPFFGTVRLFKFFIFFRNFFYCFKGSPINFLIFCNRMDVQKIPKSLFYIFRHYATYRRLQKNSKKKSEKFFPQLLVFWELLLSPVVEKVVFESYWALDMAPTWPVPGLFLSISCIRIIVGIVRAVIHRYNLNLYICTITFMHALCWIGWDRTQMKFFYRNAILWNFPFLFLCQTDEAGFKTSDSFWKCISEIYKQNRNV